MDPGTILATVTTTIALISDAVQYIKNAKGHDKDRAQLRAEASALSVLLTDLKDDLSALDAEDSFAHKYGRNLQEPLKRLQGLLEALVTKLTLNPQSRTAYTLSVLKWPISSKEAAEILENIERIKSLILISLARDGNSASRDILTTLRHVDGSLVKLEQDSINLRHGELLAWLSPIDFKKKQIALESSRDPNTLAWVVQNPTVNKWLDDGGHLTVIAPGGTGKTVLLSYLVQHLSGPEQPNCPVLYIYCNHNEQKMQTIENLLGSLVRQLFSFSEQARQMITDLRKQHDYEDVKPTTESLLDILKTTISNEKPVFLLIDALDELNDQDRRRQKLLDFVSQLQINLLVTTRPIENLQSILDPCEKFYFAAKDEDVECHVIRSLQRLLNRIPSAQNPMSSPLEEVANEIVQKSQGLFQAAVLCLASIADCVTLRQIRDVARRLPEGLFPMYTETLDRVRSQGPRHADLAMKALMWVSFARRELAIDELRSAVAVESDMVALHEEDLPTAEGILSSCCGLLTVSEDQHSVGFCHYTAQEYFVKNRDQLWPSAQEIMASTCITYASFNVFLDGPLTDYEDSETRKWTNPFLEYSAFHWGYHAREAPETSLLEKICKFLWVKPLLENVSQFGPYFLLSGYPRQTDMFVPEPIHLASFFGLELTVRRIIAAFPWSTDCQGPGEVFPWQMAVDQEEIRTLLILVENASLDELYKMLKYAVEKQKREAAEVLLDLRNSKRPFYSIELKEILMASCRTGDYATAQMLLSKIDDIDASSSKDGIMSLRRRKYDKRQEFAPGPLQIASRMGFISIVDLLLDFAKRSGFEHLINRQSPYASQNINTRSPHGTTCLYEACRHGHLEVAQRLLQANANPLIGSGENGLTCLHGAAIGAHEDIILLLLPLNPLKAIDGKWRTPLDVLIQARSANQMESKARTRCLRHLVKHEDQLKGPRGVGYLWLAAGSSDAEAPRWLEILLDNGVAVNGIAVNAESNELNWSPLHKAADRHRAENLRTLIRYGGDPNSRDSEGEKPLHYAAGRRRKYGSCSNGGLQTVALLLEHGSDLNLAAGRWNLTALDMAIMASRAPTVKLLLEKGADPKACDIPPLCLAAANKTTSCLEALLEHGGTELAEDRWGNSVLAYAAAGNSQLVISYLAAQDEWTRIYKKQSHAKSTACHWAILCSHRPVVANLLGRMSEIERRRELSTFNYAAMMQSLAMMHYHRFWYHVAWKGTILGKSAASEMVDLLLNDFETFKRKHDTSRLFTSSLPSRASAQESDFAYGVSLRSSNLEELGPGELNYAFADVASIASGSSPGGSVDGAEPNSRISQEDRIEWILPGEPGDESNLEYDLEPGFESGRESGLDSDRACAPTGFGTDLQ